MLKSAEAFSNSRLHAIKARTLILSRSPSQLFRLSHLISLTKSNLYEVSFLFPTIPLITFYFHRITIVVSLLLNYKIQECTELLVFCKLLNYCLPFNSVDGVGLYINVVEEIQCYQVKKKEKGFVACCQIVESEHLATEVMFLSWYDTLLT